MERRKLDALAKVLAKDIKTEADLNTLSRELLKLMVETALNAELTKHLGYEKHQDSTPGKGNTLNGSTANVNGQFNLAVMYFLGTTVPKDETQAAGWYRKAAEQGHAQAQSNLGLMYANGLGLPRDEKQAVCWFRKSAEQGEPRAQNSLGLMYANGRGVEQDQELAYF